MTAVLEGRREPAPRRGGSLDPRIVLVIATVIGGLAAYNVDWKAAVTAFTAVLSLFTARSKGS